MARATFGLLLLLLVVAPAAVLGRKRVSQASGCTKSPLAGYTSVVDLNGKGLKFHWAVSGSTLSGAVEASSGQGSVSVGFSKNGKMFPSQVVTRFSGGSVKAYKFSSQTAYSAGNIKGSNLKSASGASAFKFTRSMSDGANSVIWAYGADSKKPVYHGKNFGSKSVDFSCIG